MELIVCDPESLAMLRRPATRSTIQRVTLRGPFADPRLEQRLNAAYFSCGCDTGSMAITLTLATSMLLGLLHGFVGLWSAWRILVYLATAALLGKGVGLLVSRVRLRQIYRELDNASRDAPWAL